MKSKTIPYHSSNIYYRIIGEGKPVVLIHGFGEDGDIWNRQVEFLKELYKFIIPDLPGSGKSTIIRSQLTVGIEAYAETIMAILSEEDIGQCSMIGHSMGGYITLAFAEKYPQLLSKIGLVHSSAYADNEEKKSVRLKAIEFIKKNGAYEFLKTSIPGLFKPPDGSKSSTKLSDDSKPSDCYLLIEKGRSFSDEALIQYYRAMIARPDRTNVLKDFNGSILFIIGEHDLAVPFQQSLQQSYLPHQSHIHVLRNSAHMGILEETGATNNFLLQFLQ